MQKKKKKTRFQRVCRTTTTVVLVDPVGKIILNVYHVIKTVRSKVLRLPGNRVLEPFRNCVPSKTVFVEIVENTTSEPRLYE